MISLDDISTEANTARRKFWEMCASNAITLLPDNRNENTYQGWHDFGKFYDYAEFVASLADAMLAEWDKRWIEAD